MGRGRRGARQELPAELFDITVEKLVHGGQGLATLPDGRKVFVWNALPGEQLRVRIIKEKKSYAEAIAEEVVQASAERIEPQEANYLATSPWQMMTFQAENAYKKAIVEELFAHEKVALPAVTEAAHDDRQWHYRSKMEYSFWGDDDGLHLALHQRGSHGKQIVQGSKLAMPAVDAAANAICTELNRLGIRAGDLKTIIVRAAQDGSAAAALFVKPEVFADLPLPPVLKGLRVYHSDPRSPASVPTKLLYEHGDCLLHDDLLGTPFVYDVDSFFQVNLPLFQQALGSIRDRLREYMATVGSEMQDAGITDMYAGVGSIGLSVTDGRLTLVELDPASVRMAAQNAAAYLERGGSGATVVEAGTEKSLDYITGAVPVIFDPPRAGLHDKVVEKVLASRPPLVIYMSCNPATHARDLAKLQNSYTIEQFEVYNFFPRTPHIETLAVLRPAA